MEPDRVIFACVHSAGRSQMAAAWLDALADPAKARAEAAGTQPGPRVHPEVVAVMREVGIDLSRKSPQKLTAELASGAALLVTMGCGEQCPVVPGVARDDWPLEDPKGRPAEAVRRIRDDVRARVERLVAARGWGGPRPEAARPDDREPALALIARCGLPTEGVFDGFPSAYRVIRVDGALAAVAGLEVHGTAGLLRSVAVDPPARGRGLGAALVRALIERAAGLDSVFLLTTGASDWFTRLGFTPASRDTAPAALRASSEFTSVCPSTAACLVYSRTP